MKLSGLTLLALLLTILVAGSLFGSLVLHLVDQYFCPFSGGDFCSGIEKLLFHLTYFKTSFLSFLPLFFVLFLGFAVYPLLGKERLEKSYNKFRFQSENLFKPEPHLRWLAIHTNSPTASF